MSVRSGQLVTVLFTTRVFSTGVGTNADSLPTGTLYLNGTSNAATVTVTNISTGLYKAAVTLPTLAIGDEVEIAIAATVSTIADTAVIWGDTKDILLDSSGEVTYNNAAPPTSAAIATAIWQDTTAGDFTVASSIGKSLYTSGAVPGTTGGLFIAGTNAATTITTGLTAHIIGTVDIVTTVTNQLTAAQIATGVWTDTTAGDFTTALSIGKSIMNGVSLGTGLTVNALTNAPTSGDLTTTMKTSVQTAADAAITANVTIIEINADVDEIITTLGTPLTAAQIATGVWQDATASDFTTAGSIGKSLAPGTLGTAPGASGGLPLVGTNIPVALSSNNNMKSDVEEIAGNSGGVSRLDRSARAIVTGTVGNGSSTASVVTSALSPPATTASGQFNGRVLIFDKDTTTANLRGQATTISGATTGGILTVAALTDAPVSGDTFTIT